MKKIGLVIYTIIFTCLFSTLTFAKTPDSSDCQKLLYTLEILDTVSSEEKTNEGITRAEFAVIAGKAKGFSDIKIKERYFIDVPLDHWAVGYINQLVDINVLDVSAERLFRPGDLISVDEAIKILIGICDYEEFAEVMGGYPTGYRKVAQRLDFSYCGSSEPITREQLNILVYEALNVEVYDMKKTLLEIYFDVFRTDGIVMQAGGISFNSITGRDNKDTIEKVVIGTEIFDSDIILNEYLGRFVTVFYHQEEESDVPRIICQVKSNKREQIVDINIEDFQGFKDGKISYYDEKERKKYIEIPQSAIIVKNGALAWDNMDKTLNGVSKGRMRVIDNNDDEMIDYIIIEEYKNIIVDRISDLDFTIYDKVNVPENVILDENERIVIIEDYTGTKKSFSDIKKGQVISVYESENYVKAIICAEGVGSVLYASKVDDEGIFVEIGKNENDKSWRKIDDNYFNKYFKNQVSFAYGSNITYYLDVAGNIAYLTIESPGDGWIIGYLVSHHIDNGIGEYCIMMKIFNQYGELKKYEVSEKTVVDGSMRKGASEIINSIDKINIYGKTLSDGEDRVNGQVIRFKLNADGEIIRIDSENVNYSKEDVLSLHRSKNITTLRWWYYISGFQNGEVMYKDSTIHFEVPEYKNLSSATPSDFTVTSGNYRDVTYTIESFKLDNSDVYDDIIVAMTSEQSREYKGPYLVKSLSEVWEDDEIFTRITVVDPVTCAELILNVDCDYDLKDINSGNVVGEGDLIRVSVGLGGKIETAQIYYDFSQKNDDGHNVSTGWKIGTAPTHNNDYTFLYSYIKKMTDRAARLIYTKEITEDDFEYENIGKADFTTLITTDNILIYDGKHVTKGTWQDIVTAEVSGADNAEKYWLIIHYGRVVGVVVYR